MRSRDGQFNRVYWRNEAYVPKALKAFDRFMWDWRARAVAPIDPRLLDILFDVGQSLRKGGGFSHVLPVSGCRTPHSNSLLGAVPRSYYLKGMAADIRPTNGTLETFFAAVERVKIKPDSQFGGVDYSFDRRFAHVDCGPRRGWAE